MTKQKFPCKNHPQKTSAKRCFVCKDYICTACQNIWSHHLFCSFYCYLKYLLNDYKKFLISNNKIVSLFLILQVVTIIIVLRINSDDNNLNTISSKIEHSEELNQDSLTAFVVDTNSVPNSNLLLLTGETRNNSLLGLWQNGKLIQSNIPYERKYKFEPIALKHGKNVI